MSERKPIEETDLFLLFDEVSDWAWDKTAGWEWFEKKSVGMQLVTSLDSVVSNLVEGDGRYRSADGLHFFVMARASAREGRLWIRKAAKRGLVDKQDADKQIEKLESAAKQLNALIQFRRSTTATLGVKEETLAYCALETD